VLCCAKGKKKKSVCTYKSQAVTPKATLKGRLGGVERTLARERPADVLVCPGKGVGYGGAGQFGVGDGVGDRKNLVLDLLLGLSERRATGHLVLLLLVLVML
jgi:hypothetical protein